MPDASPAMTLQHVRFSYARSDNGDPDKRPLVIDIPEFLVKAGEIVVLMGDNGCGKTTLLKIMAGLLSPEPGAIIDSVSSPILVHQRPFLFTESVQGNVAWPLRLAKVPRKERAERVKVALRKLGIEHLAQRWAPSLSGGEKQRVAIARALVTEPCVLLLDEPTSNIDQASVERIEKVLKDAAGAGVAVVMSTHNYASAYRIADTVLSMNRGTVRVPDVNILRGETCGAPSEHIGRFRVNDDVEIFCPLSARVRTTAVIRMDDIILATNSGSSSAQNHLSATVLGVCPIGSEVVRVDLDCGVPLSAHITHRSVDELGVDVGKKLEATFKASAVELY